MKTDFRVNLDFSYMCVFKLGTNEQFWLYNQIYAEERNKLDSEEYFSTKALGLKGSISSIRNQNIKPNAYCVFKSVDNEITVNCFFSKDTTVKKKTLKLRHSHQHVSPDAIVMSQMRDPTPGESNSKVGILCLEQYSQNLSFKVFQPELGKLEMNLLSSRVPVTQRISAQYPCTATNLG